jgi:hypothetical protein
VFYVQEKVYITDTKPHVIDSLIYIEPSNVTITRKSRIAKENENRSSLAAKPSQNHANIGNPMEGDVSNKHRRHSKDTNHSIQNDKTGNQGLARELDSDTQIPTDSNSNPLSKNKVVNSRADWRPRERFFNKYV